MKMFVTGAHGYVGRYVVKHLLALGHDVVIASHRPSEPIAGTIDLQLDVLDSKPDIFDLAGRPDCCVHLAWTQGFVHGHRSHIENVDKHIRFLRNMLSGGLRHFVGIGTMHEIGYHVGPVTEDTPTNPQNAYGIAKNYLQRVQALLCKEAGAVNQWLRCYYITGDDRRNNSIFRKILDASDEGRATFPLNSGEMLFDFIDVDDLGLLIASVASQNDVAGTINCCSGVPLSLKSMVLKFIAERSLKIEPEWGAFPARPYDSLAIWGDRRKLDLALAAYHATRK